MKNSSYVTKLILTVIKFSESKEWSSARYEWEICNFEEDDSLSESCICGKEHLKYLFTIKNRLNNNELYPIGSSCINKFGRDDLDEQVSIKEQLFKLLHAVENNSFLELTTEYFSRKLLKYLYDEGAFKTTKYNNFNPYNDYKFMLDMFNKRKRTIKQNQKATAIILNSIKPYLENLLKDKIKTQHPN